MEHKKSNPLVNISKKTFLQVTILLFALVAGSAILTYVIPRGEFGALADGSVDYLQYIRRDDLGGVSPVKAIFAPILVFFSSDGLALLMLTIFLFVISASFQVMNDVGGIGALVSAVSTKFRDRKRTLLVLISLLFYCFGSFLGLFEEMLTMLPVVAILCVTIGYDSFTGFLCCIVACGFGFAGAITNPFTVLLASEIIGVNPMEHVWYRLIIFAVMFLLFLGYLFFYVGRIGKDPTKSVTLEHDRALREKLSETEVKSETLPQNEKKARIVYTVFLSVALLLIITASAVSALRGYTVPILIAYFLLFGLLAGTIVSGDLRKVLGSFGKGFLGALPTIVFIAFAASVKYIFEEGKILPTVVHQINTLSVGKNVFLIALLIYLIVLALEFFISSSTAKAVLVMGLLAMVQIGLSKEMMVLLYTFADGYTNVLFPTSPVLLISLSMIGVDYFRWVKKSLPLFAANVILVVAFILIGVAVGY